MIVQPWVRTRIRQSVTILLMVSCYLCSGAAWKVWMVVRHPPDDGSVADAIRQELRPYKGLPVAYALGPSFGRVAAALRLAVDETGDRRASLREAARLSRSVARSGSTWADLAAYNLAVLEAAPGVLDAPSLTPTRTLLIRLDSQRWGRSTEPVSSLLPEVLQQYRSIVRDHPRSTIAFDSLLRLADNEDESWDFAAGTVDRLTARLLDPARGANNRALQEHSPSVTPDTERIAALYAEYLRATAPRRKQIVPILSVLSRDGDDEVLSDALSAGESDRETSPEPQGGRDVVRVLRDGAPIAGARVALLDPSRLRLMSDTRKLFGAGAANGFPLSRTDVMQTLTELNPVRVDDPLQAGGAVLISPLLASEVVRHLVVRRTGPDGKAYFADPGPSTSGLALLFDSNADQPDVSLGGQESGVLALVPPVQIRPPVLSLSGPPVLRWRRYAGASQYGVVVALEPTASPGSRSVAVGADWDRHVTWWRDGIAQNQVRMDPAGFTGPLENPAGNGLWSGTIYRIIVVAEDAAGAPIASSLAMQDHPSEFFTPPGNWLGLSGPGARVPARGEMLELPILRRPRLRPSGPGNQPGGNQPGGNQPQRRIGFRADPLEQVMELSRSLNPAPLLGASTQEPALIPVDAESTEAVVLAHWPSIRSRGRGNIPLGSPFLGGLLSATFGTP